MNGEMHGWGVHPGTDAQYAEVYSRATRRNKEGVAVEATRVVPQLNPPTGLNLWIRGTSGSIAGEEIIV